MSKSRMTRGLLTAATLTVAALMVGCSSGAGTAANDTTPSTGSSEIDALIAEAKKEGSVSVYAVVDERMIQEVQRAFTDEYGIDITKILPLGDDVAFLCGHGPGSTIGVERQSNPFLQD